MEGKNTMKNLFRMFLTFIKIGTFTLGGGYAMLSLIEEEVVEKNKWLESDEFIDIIALAQTIPGALAINSATYIGYRLFGFRGALLGCLGMMLPSVISILFVALVFTRIQNVKLVVKAFSGIRPAVVALILSAVLKMGNSIPKTILNLIWLAITVLSVIIFNIHPIIVIIVSGIVGYLFFKGDYSNGNNH